MAKQVNTTKAVTASVQARKHSAGAAVLSLADNILGAVFEGEAVSARLTSLAKEAGRLSIPQRTAVDAILVECIAGLDGLSYSERVKGTPKPGYCSLVLVDSLKGKDGTRSDAYNRASVRLNRVRNVLFPENASESKASAAKPKAQNYNTLLDALEAAAAKALKEGNKEATKAIKLRAQALFLMLAV